MAQYRLNAYDADVYIPEFKGLYQYGDQMGSDLRFSPDCQNVETPGGVLQPVSKLKSITILDSNGNQIAADTDCTLMFCRMTAISSQQLGFKYKYITTVGPETTMLGDISQGQEYDCILFVVGKKLYEINIPLNRPADFDHFTSFYTTGSARTFTYAEKWNWCTYEAVFTPAPDDPPGRLNGRTNTIIMTGEKNGTYYFASGYSAAMATSLHLRRVARYAERIWGVGSGDNKDVLYYSKTYNTTDWSIDSVNPEDSGGEIREPTFDNDKIVALVPFGDSLIAFSEQRAWRITGTDPSNFYIHEQYGNGTRYPDTIKVMGDRIIMLGEHGLVSYDGNQVYPFMKESTYELFRNELNPPLKSESPVAVVWRSKYILSLSNKLFYQSSTLVKDGYIFLIYDNMDGSVVIADSPQIKDLCTIFPYAYSMVITASNKVDLQQLQFDSFDLKDITGNATKWVTPWIDLGRKDIQKGGFELYFYPELNTDDVTATVTLKFSIQTEKKTKSKSYVVHALTADERTAGKKYKQKRLHFGGAGRRFRLIIETEAGNTVPWRLIGGVHIIAETDRD